VNAKRRRATVSLRVQDKNDNAPAFMYNASYNRFIPRKYLAIVTELTKKGTRIFFFHGTQKTFLKYFLAG
jgi:hypothetical protein